MTIGVPGTKGFGVGVCQLDSATLQKYQIQPFQGYDDVDSDNYGNYVHTPTGSVMVYIPAFCYRIGNQTDPRYQKYQDNLIEISDKENAGVDGWILHRAFIDRGTVKSGVFVDKYLSSKDETNSIPVSVKNGECIMMTYHSQDGHCNCSSSMNNDDHTLWGHMRDAVFLAKRRGPNFVCLSCFVWSAITMLCLAHAQAASSTDVCGWYDPAGLLNWPKGNTSDGTCKDFRDDNVSFTSSIFDSTHSLTGSGTPFNKTTHNGQNNGITDVSGNFFEPAIGIGYSFERSRYMVLKPSGSIYDFEPNSAGIFENEKDVYNNDDWEEVPWDISKLASIKNDVIRFGTADNLGIFFKESDGPQYSCCGVIPTEQGYHITSSDNDNDDETIGSMFANNAFKVNPHKDNLMMVGGFCFNSSRGGIFLRYITSY